MSTLPLVTAYVQGRPVIATCSPAAMLAALRLYTPWVTLDNAKEKRL